MSQEDFQQLLKRGIAETDKGHTMIALLHLENAARLGSSPLLSSYLGYCIATERREFKPGVALCNEALRLEPQQPLHYLNLGRIYLAANQKAQAIKILRKGLKSGRHPLIVKTLKQLGIRHREIFPSLSRHHLLNRLFGRLFHRLGLR